MKKLSHFLDNFSPEIWILFAILNNKFEKIIQNILSQILAS